MDNIDQELSQRIHQQALHCGYDGCGIIPLSDLAPYKKRLAERMEKIPESAAFYGFFKAFTSLSTLFPWAKAIIVCTFWLGKYKYPQSLQGKWGKAFVLSPDTVPDSPDHQRKLQFENWLQQEGIHFTGGEDNAPARLLPLRQAAVADGLGIFRRNNFFYGEKGSYYMLEGYLIDQSCEYYNTCTLRPCSEKCGLCQKACPTHSLSAAYTMNPLTCVSFLTTFGEGVVKPPLSEKNLGAWLCGCDACQDACPYNRCHNWNEGKDFYQLEAVKTLLEPENILSEPDTVLRQKVIPKTERHIPPAKIEVLRRNAARVLRWR